MYDHSRDEYSNILLEYYYIHDWPRRLLHYLEGNVEDAGHYDSALYLVTKCLCYLEAYSKFCASMDLYKKEHKVTDYFKAASELEGAIYHFYTFKNSAKNLTGILIFESGSGVAEESINKLYNYFKHDYHGHSETFQIEDYGIRFKKDDENFLSFRDIEFSLRKFPDLCEEELFL